MNKFAILAALLSLVALATCSPVNLEDQSDEFSELKIKPDDDGEVAHLAPEHQVFDSFCRESRDHVYTYITDKNRELVSNVFAAFFGSITDVTKQLEELQIAEAEKATKAIMEGTGQAPAEEGAETEKSAGLIRSVASALKNYVIALGRAGLQEGLTRIALLKAAANNDNLRDVLTNTCTDIQLKLMRELQALFKDTKAEIAGSNPGPEVANMLTNATFDKVGCLTTGRARKIVNVCGLLNTAGPMILNMMGM